MRNSPTPVPARPGPDRSGPPAGQGPAVRRDDRRAGAQRPTPPRGPGAPAARAGRASQPFRRNEPAPRFSDTDKADAKAELDRAFAMLGLVDNGHPVCPSCGANKPKKVVLRPQKLYWKCFPCGARGDAIELLTRYGGYSFPDAVNALLGRPVRSTGKPVTVPEVVLAKAATFHAVVDSDVYDALVGLGSCADAQRYYGRFHISPEAVAEARCVVVADPQAAVAELTARFGQDRLVACGVLQVRDDGSVGALINRAYPVIEPHLRPDGRVVGMQFRPSLRQEARFQAHKAYVKAVAAAEAAGTTYTGAKADYVPKFLSLKGGGDDHLVGLGVARLAHLPAGSKILIVEGGKDQMAARTMGAEAYGIPGVGVMPPVKVCRLLARHTAILCMDADEGGDIGTAALQTWFDEHGVPWQLKKRPLPPGFDVTDVLIDRHARQGCTCTTCQRWRADHR